MEDKELDEVLDMPQPAKEYLMKMPDEVLRRISFSMPWQYSTSSDNDRVDPDGFDQKSFSSKYTRERTQDESWNKLHENPQVNTSIRGQTGRLTGFGFETTSEIFDIQEEIYDTELDPRNRLYNFWPKWISRFFTEGELFLILTLHTDGFVEVDFLDPKNISEKGDDDTGIIFHPDKWLFPLFYMIFDDSKTKKLVQQIPSINIARYPNLVRVAAKHKDYNRKYQQKSRSRKHIYRSLGGYFRFVVAWDRGFMTRRSVSYLRTVLEWLNHYENLKKYEIDHKKSSGAYAWVFTFEDPRAFKLWMSLDDSEKRKTGIAQKITPGSRLILPPGMSVEAKNPNLTSIKEQDTDILHMVGSGLNESEDIMMGSSGQKLGAIKASRGPMSDRISDEIAYFDRFQKYDFWSSIFFLKSAIERFPKLFKVKEAYAFDQNQEPLFKEVARRPEMLIDIQYPMSEALNFEDRAKGLLGVKHGPVAESLGIPNSTIARQIGLGGYGRKRLQKATEDDKYPELVYNIDSEKTQEIVENNPEEE